MGDVELEFLYTPGHTPDSVTIRTEQLLFTGDTLFIGGAGRTDLPGGDPGQHYDSLFTRIALLPDDLVVYPAHDYFGKSSSRLGEEKERNEYFERRSRIQYVEWLQNRTADTPDWMLDVLKANYACARDPRAAWIPADAPACMLPNLQAVGANEQIVRTISPEEVRDRRTVRKGNRPVILDVREPEEYVGPLGHLEDAVLVPVGQLPDRLAQLEPYRDREIITVCKAGGRSATAASVLMQAGFTHVLSMDGGMQAWNERGYPTERR